jgi:hypothetical protein
MVQSTVIVIFRGEIINVIHHGVSAPQAMAARQCRNGYGGEHHIEEGTHEIPFLADNQGEPQ